MLLSPGTPTTFYKTEADEADGAKGGGRVSALLTLGTEPPVPGVFGWSSPRPTDASSDRAGVPPLWQLVGTSVPASTQGLNWGGLVRGAAQVRQLSPSSWGLATLGMWLPMGDVEAHRAARPDLLGATGHSPGSGLSGLGPNFVALHGSSHDEEDHGSSHNEEDLTTWQLYLPAGPDRRRPVLGQYLTSSAILLP